ncbi:LLM class flavin-dependent oxidoreductase [Amycolatopsis acidicola]|uniref:LLM class flavin-dependent oxidoreductase n=1 Tax=Amycolatopsis acidicola TaxID=2596893 RepID=A0A5N0VJI2_9PSEU|nr:LLM class flavin-dependent oxidoreductase [Amycolatopsis acidicola]KAA9166479.1 LLM class flavin-dependent oxidoreductase [Amycolatopsis acidicola]
MKFGILLTSIYDGSTPARRQRDEHAELVATAEQAGFSLMVAGQHFLGAELRYFQPVPWLTYMSRHAPSMDVATGIILLSMVNPVDTAEQLSTLDVLTGGRARFGVGLGYSPHEFDAFGVAKGERVPRFEESLELIRQLWSGEKVTFHGRFTGVTDARPAVRPLQAGGPPVWIGGQAAGAVKRAARLGDAWYSPPFPTHDELYALHRLFTDTRAEAGSRPAKEFPVRRELLIADSREDAIEAALVRYRARYETYRKWGLNGQNTPVGKSGEELREDIDQRFILGSPEECAAELHKLGAEIGMTHFVYKPHWPGLPHAEAMRQLDRFGSEVVPLLKD